MNDDKPYAPCLRSGLCCTITTCGYGLAHGAPPKGCTFLDGDHPGFYSCALAESDPRVAEGLSIGEGCCSTMFNPGRAAAARDNPAMMDRILGWIEARGTQERV